MYTSQSGNNVKVFIISNWIYGKTIFEYNHLHSDTLGLIIGAFIKSCYVLKKGLDWIFMSKMIFNVFELFDILWKVSGYRCIDQSS